MAAIAADRNLLLGLLALQNGLINQAQLLAAFQAWTLDKSRSLADHLEARGDLNGAKRTLLEALAEFHLEAHGGDVEESLATVSAGRSTRESLTNLGDPDIDATLAHVKSRPGPDAGATDDGSDRTASYAVGTVTNDCQRFRVLKPHARGGLGAVFVALDAELNREVALKQLLDHHADDPSSRKRFLVEAEVTGGLEHPGIVPVYSLGSYADGRPYYAMRFIRGESLGRAIGRFHADETLKNAPGRRSLELRKLLRRFMDVCNAIDYAHSRGVLHRDIKPGNVIVGRHGETLVVDWGLAKPTGKGEPGAEERALLPGSASGSAETPPGSALGTPAYMSPEQARGEIDRLGPRSDVYSLGGTLYCLLTGKAPQEDDVGEVLRRVESGEFAPPRQVDPTVDRALEAVCLKAMALQPEDRYASCRALADDLERWMADEPVAARPEPWTRTLMRWLTRHRTGVTATAAGLLVALAGTATVLAVQTRANGLLQRANEELTSSRDREAARFALAMDAIRTFHTGVAEDVLLKQSELADLRTKLLGEARQFYGKLEAISRDQFDTSSSRALAQTYHGLGEVTREVGSYDQALEIHRRALSLQQGLSRGAGDSLEAKAERGRSHQAIGLVLRELGRTEEGLAEHAQGIALLEEVAHASPGDTRAQLDLLRSYDSVGHLLIYAGRYAEALASYDSLLKTQQALAAAHPDEVRFRVGIAASLVDMSLIHDYANRMPESLETAEKAREAAEAAVAAKPKDPEARQVLGVCQGHYGNLLWKGGRLNEAIPTFNRAREILESLVQDHPTSTEFRLRLGECLEMYGEALLAASRITEAIAGLRKAEEVMKAIAESNRDSVRYQMSMANISGLLGDALLESGRDAESLVIYEHALVHARAAARPQGDDFNSQYALAISLLRLARMRTSSGRMAEAVALLREAIAIYDQLHPQDSDNLVQLAQAQSILARVAGQPGAGVSTAEGRAEADKAMATLRRATDGSGVSYDNLRHNRDFDSLRDRDDFRLLLLDLAFPAEPFARTP